MDDDENRSALTCGTNAIAHALDISRNRAMRILDDEGIFLPGVQVEETERFERVADAVIRIIERHERRRDEAAE
jgi:hypothetical protein